MKREKEDSRLEGRHKRGAKRKGKKHRGTKNTVYKEKKKQSSSSKIGKAICIRMFTAVFL